MKFNNYFLFAGLISLFTLISDVVNAQREGWKQCYGGSSCEGCNDPEGPMGSIKTLDNGYAFVTTSNSSDGDVIGYHGGSDFWIVKLDTQGVIQWQRSIGTSDDETAYSICQSNDSNYYVVGNVSAGTMGCGTWYRYDYAIKLDPAGNIIHQKCLGSGYEDRSHISATTDGGCIIISMSDSPNDSSFHGNEDIWIVKLDSSLNIKWQKCYGGASVEVGCAIKGTPDNGCVFTGRVRSTDGDLNLNYGWFDAWVVKLDSIGNIQWQNLFGGSGWEYPKEIISDNNKNILVAGYTSSNDFTVTGNHGSTDAWVIKMDSLGNHLWQRCYGGILSDGAFGIDTAENGFILSGFTSSNDGDVSGNQNNQSGWVFQIDSSGNLLWQKCYSFFPYALFQNIGTSKIFIGQQTDCTHGSWDIVLQEMKPSNFILGKVFVDYNSNNQFDTGEPEYQNVIVGSIKSGLDSLYSFSDQNGNYWNYPLSGTYITSLPQGVRYYIYQPTQYSSSFGPSGQYDTLNFILAPIPGIHDLRVTLLPVTNASTGLNAFYRLQYNNVGTDTSSGTIYLIKDSSLIFVSSSPIPDGIVGDSIFWNYSSLLPFESRNIDITLNVPIPPVINPGDTLILSSGIQPSFNDTTPDDNISSIVQIVLGSFDPNDKLVLSHNEITPTQIANGEYITYMIRFQNTGNTSANTIIVRDTINNFLDKNSLEIISTSHPYQMFLDENIITWAFSNIQLPDSGLNENGSHGYICYKIKPETSVVTGVVIPNRASIYFDFNQPILTNTANVYVVNLLSIIEHHFDEGTLLIYPNPTLDKIEVKIKNNYDEIEKIIVLNAIGKVIIEEKDSESLSLLDFPQGIYFINVLTKKGYSLYSPLVKE